MTAPEVAAWDVPRRSPRAQGLAAAALLLLSAALQVLASLERWGERRTAWDRADISIEDHRFDYWFPAAPWENLGAAAQLYGLGMVALAGGVAFLAFAAASNRTIARRLCLVAAAPPAVFGVHALISGLMGAPSPLGFTPIEILLGLAQTAGLILLALVCGRRSAGWAVGAVLLLGTTTFGYLVSTFGIAPAIVGYQSHDTTPFTETVFAAWAAASAVAVAVGSLTWRAPSAGSPTAAIPAVAGH